LLLFENGRHFHGRFEDARAERLAGNSEQRFKTFCFGCESTQAQDDVKGSRLNFPVVKLESSDR
jgi:hypothetical protein